MIETPALQDQVSVAVDVADIESNPWNAKGRTADADLVAGVKSKGLLQPIRLRPHPAKEGKFQIVFGERRWDAIKQLKLPQILAYIQPMDDRELQEIMAIENLHRKDLHPIEMAKLIGTLLAKFKPDDVAAELGLARETVVRRRQLLKLSDKVRKAWESGALPSFNVQHYERLARYEASEQDAMLQRLDGDETLETLDGMLQERYHLLTAATWKLEDDTLVPKAGACSACPKRSSCSPDLFGESKDKKNSEDRCLDHACWEGKAAALIRRKEAELRKESPDLVLIKGEWVRDDVEYKGKQEVLHYGFHRVGKDEKGAKRALVVQGKGKGQATWIKMGNEHTSSGRGGSTAKAKPKTMKEKEEGLEKRRRIFIIGKVNEVLEDSEGKKWTAKEDFGRMVAFICAFGTDNMALEEPTWKGYRQALAKPPTASQLWQLVLPRLTSDLHAETQRSDPKLEGAWTMADLLGLDEKALRAEAEKEIPRPKSWGEEGEKPARKATKPAKPTAAGVRYTTEQKQEVLDFIAVQDGRGAVAAAVKKFGVADGTIRKWVEDSQK